MNKNIETECTILQEELKKYRIHYGTSPYCISIYDSFLKTMTQEYNNKYHELFRQNYDFYDFCYYVATESINQGYQTVSEFLKDLYTYLIEAERCGINAPYSKSLKMDTDIIIRNHILKNNIKRRWE